MVADNWVKKNPVLSGFVGIALTCICSIGIAKATWTREDKALIQDELKKKADVTYVDRQDELIRGEIDDIEVDIRDLKKEWIEEVKMLRQDLNLKKDK